MKPPKNHFVSCLSAEFPKWDGTKLGIPEMDWGQIGNSRNGPGPNWEFPKWTGAKSGIPEMVHLEFSDSVLVFVRGVVRLYYLTNVNTYIIRKIFQESA